MPEQTPAQRAVGDIAPKLADLTDDVLFGDVWERPELVEAVTHLACYAGRPKAVSALQVASRVFAG